MRWTLNCLKSKHKCDKCILIPRYKRNPRNWRAICARPLSPSQLLRASFKYLIIGMRAGILLYCIKECILYFEIVYIIDFLGVVMHPIFASNHAPNHCFATRSRITSQLRLLARNQALAHYAFIDAELSKWRCSVHMYIEIAEGENHEKMMTMSELYNECLKISIRFENLLKSY